MYLSHYVKDSKVSLDYKFEDDTFSYDLNEEEEVELIVKWFSDFGINLDGPEGRIYEIVRNENIFDKYAVEDMADDVKEWAEEHFRAAAEEAYKEEKALEAEMEEDYL